jgi:hypothetical protein
MIMDRTRILMLETNRYRALLLQRALADKFPDSILAKFDRAEDVVEEMTRSVYAVVIVNLDALSAVETEQLQTAFRDHRPSVVMLLVSPETSRQNLKILGTVSNVVQIESSTTPEWLAERLAERLRQRSTPTGARRDASSGYLSRLALAGQ